ncbi:MAG TPA: RAD55 family ATPase [Methanomassiliicoccales archaeon]|nr:RAD55 family ATPase [Methanomassiliicoccales archaeon]
MIKASLPDMCSLLMVGSPGIGMLEFDISLAKDYLEAGETVIFVTMDVLPTDLMSLMRNFGIKTEKILGKKLFIIDYHSSLLGTIDERSSYAKSEVRPAGDIEGIMFNVAAIASEYGRPVRIFFYTLSTLFLYNQSNVVLKFFQISSSRVRNEFGTAVFSVHDGVHDERTMNHLMAIADGVIELKFDDDLTRRMRIRHMRGMPIANQWIPFEIRALDTGIVNPLLEWR